MLTFFMSRSASSVAFMACLVFSFMLGTLALSASAQPAHYTLQHYEPGQADQVDPMPAHKPYGSQKVKAPVTGNFSDFEPVEETEGHFSEKVDAYKQHYADQHPEMYQTVEDSVETPAVSKSMSGRFNTSMPAKPLKMVNSTETTTTSTRRHPSLHSPLKDMTPYRLNGSSVYFD
jgi:hypothetical protein